MSLPGPDPSAPFPEAAALPSLDNTFGAFLIGTFLSLILFGIAILQSFNYYQTYPEDTMTMKLTVGLLLLLELVRSVFSMQASYHYLVTGFFNPLELAKAHWTIPVNIPITGVMMLVTHLYFTQRIWIVSQRSVWITAAIGIISVAHFAVMLMIFGRIIQLPMFGQWLAYGNTTHAALGIGMGADLLIALVLSYFLFTSRTGVQNTDSIVNRIIIVIVNNGVLLAAVEVVVLVTVLMFPANFIYLAIFQVVGNLYANSLLATLNIRNALRARKTQGKFDLSGSSSGRDREFATGRLGRSGTGPVSSNKFDISAFPTDHGLKPVQADVNYYGMSSSKSDGAVEGRESETYPPPPADYSRAV